MKYCATCKNPATKSIETDNEIELINLCGGCFDQVLDANLKQLVSDGIITESYDHTTQDYVYRLREDV